MNKCESCCKPTCKETAAFFWRPDLSCPSIPPSSPTAGPTGGCWWLFHSSLTITIHLLIWLREAEIWALFLCWFLVFPPQPVLDIPVPQRGCATHTVPGWVLGKRSFPVGARAVLKRDISPCNSITQNKKLKLEHSAINAGSIDSCAAPSWLINPRCSSEPIPAPASLHQEPNRRTGEAEIPSWRDLLSAQSSNTTHFPKPPQFLVLRTSPGL